MLPPLPTSMKSSHAGLVPGHPRVRCAYPPYTDAGLEAQCFRKFMAAGFLLTEPVMQITKLLADAHRSIGESTVLRPGRAAWIATGRCRGPRDDGTVVAWSSR